MGKIDLLDRKIISELDLDARQPNTRIAKTLRTSKEVVSYRIRNLEKEGCIQGYYAVLNPSLLGVTYYRVLIKFYSLDVETEKEIISFLENHIYVGWVATFFGKFDLGCVVEVENVGQFDGFLYEFMEKYGSHVAEKEVFIFSSSIAFNKKFLIADYKTRPLVYTHQPKKAPGVDEVDLRLVKALSDNAREPLVNLGEDLGLAPKSVANRMKKLEKIGVVQGYRVSVDLSKLGYLFSHTLIRLENVEVREKLVKFFNQDRRTIYGALQIGAYDVSIESVAEDLEDLQDFIYSMRKRFVGDIKNYDSLVITKEYKLTYLPFEAFSF